MGEFIPSASPGGVLGWKRSGEFLDFTFLNYEGVLKYPNDQIRIQGSSVVLRIMRRDLRRQGLI